ncbi:MAG: primosomal protein N' [Deltaproteobacteria bacterium]|nr:MAG: primosomal protein N' [Deltaproteobacteria bacterium]
MSSRRPRRARPPASPAIAWASVAVDVPLRAPLTWGIPATLLPHVRRGVRVLVPFRERATTGLVLHVADALPEDLRGKRIRNVADVLDSQPLLPEPTLALVEWIARYYHAPIGEAVRLALPSGADVRATRLVSRTPGTPPPDDLPEPARALLDTLDTLDAIDPDVPAERLLQQVPTARFLHLALLEEHGLATSRYTTGDERTRARTTLDVRAVPDASTGDSPPLGARQRQVLDFLLQHGDTTHDELRDLYGTPRAVLRSLEQRGLIRTQEIEVLRDPFASAPIPHRDGDPVLTDGQQSALDTIREAAHLDPPPPVLLHGITGSGKTEVYLRAIRDTLARNRRALVLLPEIALTPQFVGVFRAAFGDTLAVLHSGLNPGERRDQWQRIRRGHAHIVIGARSALFAPIDHLGLVLVDEEHDSSFKQEDGVRYNARDAAIVLARSHAAVTILGSATPSLESLANARRNRFRYARMDERANRRPLPAIDLIDLRDHPADTEDPLSSLLSPPLQLAVRQTLDLGDQAILFLNRRGWAPLVTCHDCGETLKCPSCDVSLTWHRRGSVVRCHYCGFTTPRPDDCPTCGSDQLHVEGAGTEQVAERIAEAFPAARVGRLDRDTSRGKGLLDTLHRFRHRELDLLIGTQMVTKGHDFPGVTLVGVLNADQSLRFPDVRSGERTFQLLTQVAGRAGRAERPGRVLVQTWNPAHFTLQAARRHDFDGFAEQELRYRERMVWPPFGHLLAVRIDCPDEAAAHREAEHIAELLRNRGAPSLRLQGPAEAPIARLRNRFRVHLLVRDPQRAPVHHAAELLHFLRDRRGAQWQKLDLRVALDLDPVSLL